VILQFCWQGSLYYFLNEWNTKSKGFLNRKRFIQSGRKV